MSSLEEGLRALGIEAAPKAIDQLSRFAALLAKWNRVYNLTSIPPEQTLTHHLLDSLSILPYVGEPASLLDVGSGGGLPGIPLAICLPATSVTLLDSSVKKTRFLEQARIDLALENVEVAHARVLDFDGSFDVVTSRAFASLADFSRMTAHLLSSRGRALAMKGVVADEVSEDPAPLMIDRVIELDVPGIDSPRHLVELRRRAGG